MFTRDEIQIRRKNNGQLENKHNVNREIPQVKTEEQNLEVNAHYQI